MTDENNLAIISKGDDDNSSGTDTIVDLANMSETDISVTCSKEDVKTMSNTDLRLELSRKGLVGYMSSEGFTREELEKKVLESIDSTAPLVVAYEKSNFEMIEPDVFERLSISDKKYELERRGICLGNNEMEELRKELRTALKKLTPIIN